EKALYARSGVQSVQTQTRIRQALEGLAHVGFDREMRKQALLGELPLAALLQPGRDDFAIDWDLVEVVAAQTLVAQVGDPLEQQVVGTLERLLRFLRPVAGRQRLGVPPPDLLRRKGVGLGKPRGAVQG